MQDRASELPRIHLLGGWVNRPCVRVLSATVFLWGLASPGPMDSEEFTVVFLGGFDDALLGETLSAEGCYEGVVLAA
jgi:hypothetical protein